jgi:catechol 1,2-dioxygenase
VNTEISAKLAAFAAALTMNGLIVAGVAHLFRVPLKLHTAALEQHTALLDMWQADAEGRYSNIHADIPEWNLRGRFHSGPDGTFEVQTILPPPYEIPKGGPTGAALSSLGRHCFRPAHLHLKLRHPQYRDLTSQVYFDGGDYLCTDVANAVRGDLVAQLALRYHPQELVARGLQAPYFEVHVDFNLVPRPVETVHAHLATG